MVFMIIGASCAGKSTFIKNTWLKEEVGETMKDLVPLTITSNAVLLGKYIGEKSRLLGCDRIPRLAFLNLGQQISRLIDFYPNKDIVLDGDRIAFSIVIDSIIDLGVEVTLLLITCSKHVSIERNRKLGFHKTNVLKSVYTKSMNLFIRYKNKVSIAKFIFTDNFSSEDFMNFSLKTAKMSDASELGEQQLTLFGT